MGVAAPDDLLRSRTVQVVLLSTLVAPLGVPLVSPTLPVVRDVFGITDAEASLLVSAYFAAGIVLAPFVGLLADRLGRRRVLAGSLVAFGLTGASVAAGPPYAVVLAVRVLQGVAAAGIFVTTVTVLGDAFEGPRRNAALGANVAALSAGAAVYPLVGGVLAAVSWTTPFLAYLLAVPVGLVVAVALPEPARHETAGPGRLRDALAAVASREGAVLYGATLLTEGFLLGAVFTAVPFLLAETYGRSPVAVGLAVTAAMAASLGVATQSGRLVARVSNYRLVATGLAAFGVGMGAVGLAPSPVVVGAGAVVHGAGAGLALPAVDAAVSELVAPPSRAGALSLRISTTFLGRTAGPVAFALAAASVGYGTMLLVAAVVAVVAAVAATALVPGPERVGE